MFFIASLSLLISGCSFTAVEFHAAGPEPPLCKTDATKENIVVFWGAAWRTNQKEVSRREAIAAKVIADFFVSNRCFSVVSISKTIDGRDALLLSDIEIIKAAPPDADSIIIIRIEELGPNLMIYLSPILWATKNEVIFNVRSIDAKTGKLKNSVSTRWSRGGPFTMNGTRSLDKDFKGALNALFFSGRGK